MAPIATTGLEPGARRRVVTSPARVSSIDPESSRVESGAVEALYVHSNVRIVAFAAGGAESRDDASAEPLPWSSPHERTIAFGLFRIYRAPGSVAFLNCGSALKPIMPKGQCWSITDNNSKFVLQIRRPNYWRIELPDSTEENLEKARELRAVFDNVLQFEKTACPFQRPFTVPLPKNPPKPTKRKSWTPVPQNHSVDYSKIVEVATAPAKILACKPQTGTKPRAPVHCEPSGRPDTAPGQDESLEPDMDSPSHQILDASCADQTHPTVSGIDKGDPKDTISHSVRPGVHETLTYPLDTGRVHDDTEVLNTAETPSLLLGSSQVLSARRTTAMLDQQLDSIAQGRGGFSAVEATSGYVEVNTLKGSGTVAEGMAAKLRRRHTGLGTLRAAPSAPQLTLLASPPSKQTYRSTEDMTSLLTDEEGRTSPTWSSDSFHSTQSWLSPITPLPPSPPMRQSDETTGTFPFPHNHIALPAGYSDDSDSPRTPVTPHAALDENPSFDSQDRTPTQLRPLLRLDSADKRQENLRDEKSESSNSALRLNSANLPEQTVSTAPLRTTVVRRRALSPLPAAATGFDGSNQVSSVNRNARSSLGALPKLLLSKTCGILLRPPSYLITLMLKVAARIAAGEWRGAAVGYDATGEHIPVDWDYSDSEWGDSWDGSTWKGAASGNTSVDDRRSLEEQFEDANQSWEVD